MNVTVRWTGLEGFKAALAAKAAALPMRLQDAVAETAYDMRDLIADQAPVDTGALRDSVTTAVGHLDATVGTGSPYGPRREFGFHGIDSLGRSYQDPPTGFFSIGFEAARAGFEARVRAALA